MDNYEVYLEMIEQGNSDGYYYLGKFYLSKKWETNNVYQGFQYLQKGESVNNPKCLYQLGKMSFEGFMVKKDLYRAFQYYRQAFDQLLEEANQGDPVSQYLVATYYDDGDKGTEYDDYHAFELYYQSAQAGNSDALNQIGVCYEYGFGTNIDLDLALKNYQAAADLENPEGQLNLAKYYWKYLRKQFYYHCARHLKAAADQGNIEAKIMIGQLHINKVEVGVDDKYVFEGFHHGAIANDFKAIKELAYCYLEGIGTDIDVDESVYWYHIAAKAGDHEAQYRLGLLYKLGLVKNPDYQDLDFDSLKKLDQYAVDQRYQNAFYWFETAVSNGNEEALVELAKYYLEEDNPHRNLELGISYLEQAVALNVSEAIFKQAKMYFLGEIYPKNKRKSAALFKKAALLGNREAQYEYGICLQQGHGVKVNYQDALYWYQKAAKQAMPSAFTAIALLYLLRLVETDQDDSFLPYLQQAVKFEDPQGCFILGITYCEGNIFSNDEQISPEVYDYGMSLIEHAAELGYSHALYHLGLKKIKDPQTQKSGIKYLEQAAVQFHSDAIAALGELHINEKSAFYDLKRGLDYLEIGVKNNHPLSLLLLSQYLDKSLKPQDKKRSNALLLKGAKLGDPRCQCAIGLRYYLGINCDKDHQQAVAWLTKSAYQNFSEAQYCLAQILENNAKTPDDFQEVIKWYQKAAQNQFPQAFTALGSIYYKGLNGEVDYVKAVEYYRMGADLSEKKAFIYLGECYQYGIGVDKDVTKAVDLYAAAASLDEKLSFFKLGMLYLEEESPFEVDIKKAIIFLKVSAGYDNEKAMYMLGKLYEKSDGDHKANLSIAFHWYYRAFLKDYLPSMDKVLEINRIIKERKIAFKNKNSCQRKKLLKILSFKFKKSR